MGKQPNRLTEAEAKEREARLKAAGITVVTPKPGTGTITFLKKAEPKAATGRAHGGPNV